MLSIGIRYRRLGILDECSLNSDLGVFIWHLLMVPLAFVGILVAAVGLLAKMAVRWGRPEYSPAATELPGASSLSGCVR